jgi:serine/threonine protein kinase/Flp pilus assembly protein TadD
MLKRIAVMSDRPEGDARVGWEGSFDEALREYIDRLNAGEGLDKEEIRRRHPEIGDRLIEEIETYEFLGGEVVAREFLGTLGDYTLRRQIGRGGMGVVYEAWQNSLDRQVALKVLPAGIAADNKAFLRFMREAKTAAQIHHPNVVAVYGMGVEQNTPYYAMEYVEGETLAQFLIRLKGAPAEAETPFGKKDEVRNFINIAEVFAAVADGLQHAHSKGIIHRDIKPSNLILDREGRLRILDFGLARLEGQESLTASGDLLGTVLYMSPEQARRKKIPVDHRTDIYSLGATLYELLAFRPPFQGKDHQDTLSQIIEQDPVELRKVNPRVARDLETIVLKCVRKEPADRYGTAEALAQDLRRFVRGDPVEARPEASWEKLSRRVRRNRTALLVAGVLSILLGALGWFVWGMERSEREKVRLLHDATVRDAAIDFYSGQLTLLGQRLGEMGSILYLFHGSKFRKGPAGVQDTLRDLEQAAEAVPERPDAPYYLALLYRLVGDERSAGREAARALERDPDFVPAEVLTREIALDQGPLGDAEVEAIIARFRSKPGWQEPWLLAYKHVRSRNWPEAAEAYGRLLKCREENPYVGFVVEALMGRGIARLRSENLPGAISDFAAARGIWPRFPEAALALGVTWYRAGYAEEAEAIFRELHAESPEKVQSEVAAWIVGVYDTLKDRKKSGEWTDRVSGWELSFLNSSNRYWEGRYEKCIEEARKALDARPDELAPLLLLGWAKIQLQWRRWGARWDGERREILVLAQRTRALYRSDWQAKALLALALQVNGRPEEALSTIEGAIRLRMRIGVENLYNSGVHGVILRLQGDLEGAEKVLLQALERYPKSCLLSHELALTYELMGRYEEAELEYRSLIERGEATAWDYSNLAGILNLFGQYYEAEETAEEALGRFPRNTSASEQLARALWGQDRAEEALEVVEAGIGELPGMERLHLVKGRILEDLGKFQEAAMAYCEELDLRLDDQETHEALGGLLRKWPDLTSLPEVAAIGEAIERRRSEGSCGTRLLETLSLIRERGKEGSGAPAPSDK